MTTHSPQDSFDDATLSPADTAIVDALKEHRDQAGLDQARLAQVKAWIGIVASMPAPEAPAHLLANTLARIAADKPVLAKIEPEETSRPDKSWFFKHIHELATMSVAASLLGIIAGVGIFHVRQSAARAACANNLVVFANAFGAYGTSYASSLPAIGVSGKKGFMGLSEGANGYAQYSNFDNLQPLLHDGLVRTVNMVCPARNLPTNSGIQTADFITIPEPARGYSYIDSCPRARASWNGEHESVIFADRNPLFDPATGTPLCTTVAGSNSENHGHKGTSVLRADGSITWEVTPAAGPDRDNIWTVREKSEAVKSAVYTGTEAPATASDIFLAP